jgi:hypothetical protein
MVPERLVPTSASESEGGVAFPRGLGSVSSPRAALTVHTFGEGRRKRKAITWKTVSEAVTFHFKSIAGINFK